MLHRDLRTFGPITAVNAEGRPASTRCLQLSLRYAACAAALLLPLRPTMTPPRAAPPRCAAMTGAEFEEARAGMLSTAASDNEYSSPHASSRSVSAHERYHQ